LNTELTDTIQFRTSETHKINGAIIQILEEIINNLEQKKIGYKKNIARLLRAVHNIPRYYMININTSLFKFNNQHLNFKEIIEYAGLNLNNSEIKNIFQ
jgi:hypothetical protein